jgi:ligand-binding sensor domain-containing protein
VNNLSKFHDHFFGFAGLALFVCLLSSCFAETPNTHISQYGHTSWRIEDGYFGGNVWAITQTKDGYIWVGTTAGLYKFDGVNFVRWRAQSGEELPSSRILDLRAARDGSLWIGTEAGLARLVKNRLVVDHRNDGWNVWKIFEDKEGKIWVSRNRPNDHTHALCQVLDTGVRCEENPDGFLGILAQDASGDLWIGGSISLMRREEGTSRVYQPQSLRSNLGNDGVSAILPTSDGSVWVGMELASRGAGLQRLVNGTLKPFLVPELNGETLAVVSLCRDRQDNVWVGTSTRGLFRIHGMDVDHYGSEHGLSGDYVDKVFEDREGNLWVATSQGLDVFRELRVKTISKREGLYEDEVQSVAASRDGSVWIGTERLQVLGAQGIALAPGKALPGDQITSIFEDHTGRLWVGAADKLRSRA